MNLREYLKTTNLITDGAFGTYFAAKYQTQDIPELANITAPEKVKKIHEEYLNAERNLSGQILLRQTKKHCRRILRKLRKTFRRRLRLRETR